MKEIDVKNVMGVMSKWDKIKDEKIPLIIMIMFNEKKYC